jgi:hypothetical protein
VTVLFQDENNDLSEADELLVFFVVSSPTAPGPLAPVGLDRVGELFSHIQIRSASNVPAVVDFHVMGVSVK